MTRSRIALVAAGVLAAAAIAWAVRGPPLAVDAATVRSAPFTLSFEEQGRTELNHRWLVAAPVAGTLRRIALQQGDPVQAGDIVAELEPAHGALLDTAAQARMAADLQAAGADAQAATERARAAAAAATLARTELARIETLRRSGTASAADLDAATSRAAQAQAALRAAQADERAAQQRREALAAVVAQQGRGGGAPIPLRAPIDGVVLRRHVESAVPVTPGQPLLEFGDPHDLNVEVDTLSQDAVKLAPGMAARVLRWGGDAPLDARVTRIEPGGFTKISALGVEEQRTRVRLDFVAPYEQWRKLGDGYRVEVEFLLWQDASVLQVPSGALFRDDGRWYAYRIEDGRARRIDVDVGVRGATATQVRGGLRAGDILVAHPDDRIGDGVRVRAVP